jgi:hypothetical protein
MALVLIPGPDNAPSTVADWDKINDVFQTIGIDINSPTRISGSKILRGSVIFFAGAWYVADSDTAISGSATDYVRLTNTAGVVTASFVSSLSNVTFNRTWNGWYDSSLRLYLFDEIKAYAAGAITSPVTIKNYRPSLNWSKAISRVLSAANLARLFRLSSEVVLTGSGNWTVPSGVYWIEGLIIGPGANGSAGSTNTVGGRGGAAGERRYFGFSVTPGQSIPYAVTHTSTIFGGVTVTKGGGVIGSNGVRGQTSTDGGRGGNGGGKGGYGGTEGNDGGNGADGEGGGGGGGGGGHPYRTPGAGGLGGLGSVRIR